MNQIIVAASQQPSWWERNKKKVMVVGGIVVVLGCAYLAYRYHVNAKNSVPMSNLGNMELLPAALPKTSLDTVEGIAENVDELAKSFPREAFIRHLPDGWRASPAKIAEAAEKGIWLNPGETYVDACIVTMRTAA